MATPAAFAPKNSTTVRFSLTRAFEWLAPKAVLDRAFEAWCTPPRAKKPRAPREGRPFEIETPLGNMKAWEWGMSDEAPTVLLVHGWGGSAVSMEKLAKPLAEAGYQVVAVDLPAHGQSPGTQTNLIEMTRVVESALWRLRPYAVVAHSLGGSAATLALEHGPKVEKLVLLAPGENVPSFAHVFAERAGLSQGLALGLLTRIEQRIGMNPELLSLRRHAPPEQTQVLVVHDPADEEVPWSHMQTLLNHWPKAELLAAPGVGHYLMPRAAAVIAAVTELIATGRTRGAVIRVLPGPAESAAA